jgi:hypothetical protein
VLFGTRCDSCNLKTDKEKTLPIELRGTSTPLDPNLEIWRYVSIDSVVNSIVNEKLRFTQLRELGDSWEGVIGFATVKSRAILENSVEPLTSENFDLLIEKLKLLQASNRTFNYVSCWSTNGPDEMLMWDAYAKHSSYCGVRTSVLSLKNSIVGELKIADIGLVTYSNHTEVSRNNLDFRDEIYRKRVPFKYENEVRFVVNREFDGEESKKLLIDEPNYYFHEFNPDCLNEIVLHPYAPEMTEEYLEKILRPIIPKVLIRRSTIAEQPVLKTI